MPINKNINYFKRAYYFQSKNFLRINSRSKMEHPTLIILKTLRVFNSSPLYPEREYIIKITKNAKTPRTIFIITPFLNCQIK